MKLSTYKTQYQQRVTENLEEEDFLDFQIMDKRSSFDSLELNRLYWTYL